MNEMETYRVFVGLRFYIDVESMSIEDAREWTAGEVPQLAFDAMVDAGFEVAELPIECVTITAHHWATGFPIPIEAE